MNNSELQHIYSMVLNAERISMKQAITLYEEAPLFKLMELAMGVKRRMSGDVVFYNRNFHLEPTNICKFNCAFCSYRKREGENQAWDYSVEEIEELCKKYYKKGVTEVHLVGAVHPNHTFEHYKNIISRVRQLLPPQVSIKAYSAVEHIEMINKSGKSFAEGIGELIAVGMDSVTGGGAEIFDETVREKICADKASSAQWLEFHKTAQQMGVKTNATMLYGHIESIEHRIEHINRLRELQDITNGFLSFIPLKYRNKNNSMSYIDECSIIEDLKTLAISRIFLDNVPHIKAYWPMYGKLITQLALLSGADDVDGTLEDSTKIYSMAGVEENSLSQHELIDMIKHIGLQPVERDTFYNHVK